MRKPLLPAVLTVLAALGPAPLLAQATTKPSLTVVLSLDGLSWSRLEHYRPWYVAGLKRLLEEGQVETEARYRHLNTETSPGHAALATGAPPRVTGVVANRWIEQNPDGSMRSVGAAQPWATDVVPGQPPLFYREVEKERAAPRLRARPGARPLGEVRGDRGGPSSAWAKGPRARPSSSTARTRSRSSTWQHGRPKETFRPTTTATGPGNLRVPTLGDRLVEASPQSRVVVVSGKDRTTVFLAGAGPPARRLLVRPGDGPLRHLLRLRHVRPGGFGGTRPRRALQRAEGGVAAAGAVRDALGAPPRPPRSRVGFGDPALPAPASGLWDFQLPTNGLGFPHDLRLSERGYFYGVYTSPLVDEITADLAVDFVADEAFAWAVQGRRTCWRSASRRRTWSPTATGTSRRRTSTRSADSTCRSAASSTRSSALCPGAPTWSRCRPTTASR